MFNKIVNPKTGRKVNINSEMIALQGTHLKKKIKEKKDCVNKIARRLGYF